uniref:DNA repair protein RecN n=1 Tax=Angiostrongylus cantonensis TaxID=6313 RepID=A0A0K0D8W4_ANGCA
LGRKLRQAYDQLTHYRVVKQLRKLLEKEEESVHILEKETLSFQKNMETVSCKFLYIGEIDALVPV